MSLKPPLAYFPMKFNGEGMVDIYLDMFDRFVSSYPDWHTMLRDAVLTLEGKAKDAFFSYYQGWQSYQEYKNWI